MKKRSLAVLMAGVMTASMMTGVVSVYADADSKTLTVGFDAEYPPFGYKDDNGEYVGFDLDLAQEVCDNLGWELVKKPINWDSKDMELNSGSIDCIWNGFTINGREDDYTWSNPYLNNDGSSAIQTGTVISFSFLLLLMITTICCSCVKRLYANTFSSQKSILSDPHRSTLSSLCIRIISL